MSQRSNQVAEELRKIISMILLDDLNYPGLGFITVTGVQMTDDLRFARVFYSVLGDEAQKEATAEALRVNLNYIRRLAVERINMKFAMDIRFEPDHSIDQSFKVESILKQIKEKEEGSEEKEEEKAEKKPKAARKPRAGAKRKKDK